MPLPDWLKTLFAARRPARHDGDRGDTATAPGDARDEPDEDEDDTDDPFPDPVQLEITDVFDLHAIAPRDTERAVRAYLHEARTARFLSVRIIHGKGRGVQRALVHKILSETAFIRDWTDAPPQSGGWGATVAHFAPAEAQGDVGKAQGDVGEARNDPSPASDA
ncbi:MAG TPA: Smr/MutS family protein [Pyrinomonadaceae bacterium]